jgi:serine/threonine-protein kinase RsbW
MVSEQQRPTLIEWVSTEAADEPLDTVHEALERLWVRVEPPDDSFRTLFSMAVAEVAANILEHARPPGGNLRMELELSVWPDRLEANFRDDGRPLARRIVARGLGANDLPERGRGLGIALVALDELGYDVVDGYNKWRLVKRRGDQQAFADQPGQPVR